MSLVIVFYCNVFVPLTVNPMIKDIDELIGISLVENTDNERFKKVRNRMFKIVQVCSSNGLPNMIPALFFGAWPFLQACSGYWLPVTWSLGCLVDIFLVWISQPQDRAKVIFLVCFSATCTVGTSRKTSPILGYTRIYFVYFP
jgi:hypothetical protein